jgi:hypothetical protein
MNIISKIETRVLLVIAVAVSMIGTIFGMKILVVEPMRRDFKEQIKNLSGIVLELGKVEKFRNENTYTIRKVKKGSQVILAPDNDMEIQQYSKGLGDKIDQLSQFNDSLSAEPKKSFWAKIKFW